MDNELQKLQIQVNTLQGIINKMILSDRFLFYKTLQIRDGLNIQTGVSNGTKIATATDQKIGFYGVTPVNQRLKANYNNWTSLSDVVNALVDLGLLDQV